MSELTPALRAQLWQDAERMSKLGQEFNRIAGLRLGLQCVIEKARYDEYGTFEDVRARIVALCQEILAEDDKLARK